MYVLRPLESSVEVCYKRCGSHRRTLTDVFKMSQAWEAVPPLYTELDVSALFGVKPGGPWGLTKGKLGRTVHGCCMMS